MAAGCPGISEYGGTSPFTKRWQKKGKSMTIDPTFHQRREENLRAMRGPASFLLAGAVLAAMILATVFYDRPITDNPMVFSYLRGLSASSVE
jgi:hypothetical protein